MRATSRAATPSRSTSPDGRPTARCTSSAIATAGGSSIARAANRSTRSCAIRRRRRSSAGRSGCSATATWVFADADRIVAAYTRAGRWHLATVHVHTGLLTDVPTGLAPVDWMAATAQHVVLVAASPERADAVVRLDLTRFYVEELRRSSDVELDAAYISTPEPIEFPTEDERTAHVFYYAPRNKNFVAPRGERPPLIVIGHGGPTTATRADLRSRDPVLDQPRVCRGGRQLRRQLRVRPRLPPSGSTASGASWTSRTSSTSHGIS